MHVLRRKNNYLEAMDKDLQDIIRTYGNGAISESLLYGTPGRNSTDQATVDEATRLAA